MDKSFWLGIVENDCKIPEGHTASELLPELLGFLGSTDPQLRDEVAYMCFARWLIRDQHFTPDEIRSIMARLLQNLDKGIGERDTDSVLLRSFSALTLSLVVYAENQQDLLSADEVASLLDAALDYLLAEQDLRGYVAEKGWHHATAHTADLLKFLCRSPKTDARQHQRVLDAIFQRMSAHVDHVYVHDEDERLTLAVLDILRRETLTLEQWQVWLEDFIGWKEKHISGGEFVITLHAPYMNCKHFLRSLYFTMQALGERGAEAGKGHEMATALLPDLLKAVRTFGSGTIYTG